MLSSLTLSRIRERPGALVFAQRRASAANLIAADRKSILFFRFVLVKSAFFVRKSSHFALSFCHFSPKA